MILSDSRRLSSSLCRACFVRSAQPMTTPTTKPAISVATKTIMPLTSTVVPLPQHPAVEIRNPIYGKCETFCTFSTARCPAAWGGRKPILTNVPHRQPRIAGRRVRSLRDSRVGTRRRVPTTRIVAITNAPLELSHTNLIVEYNGTPSKALLDC